MAWCSTFITKLKKIASKERQALQAIPFPTVESELKDKQVMKIYKEIANKSRKRTRLFL